MIALPGGVLYSLISRNGEPIRHERHEPPAGVLTNSLNPIRTRLASGRVMFWLRSLRNEANIGSRKMVISVATSPATIRTMLG